MTHGVPQGSILGPNLFLVMVADMPNYVLDQIPNSDMTSYADDSTVHAHAKSVELLKTKLEKICNRMISYCHDSGLILNNDKTQLLVSSNHEIQIKMGSSLI